MSTKKLEELLRERGWHPVEGMKFLRYRLWKHVSDGRPAPFLLRVPRTDWMPAREARRILALANAVPLR